MPIVFRGMLPGVGSDAPVVGDQTGNQLGVRDTDVVTYDNNGVPWVKPTNQGAPQGVSVAPNNGCDLPSHRRPPGAPWNGTGNKGLLIWRLDTDQLKPDQLSYNPDPKKTDHGFISPGVAMPLQQYRDLVHGTVALWTLVSAPANPCTTLLGRPEEEQPVSVPEELTAMIDGVAAGEESEELVQRLRAVNAVGVGRDTIVAAMEAGAERADQAGLDDGAERLRTILDRITGFCSPHARVELH